MTLKLLAALVLTAALGAPVGYVFYQARLSPDNWVYKGGSPTNWKGAGVTAYQDRSLAPGYQSWWRAWAPIGLSAGGATRSSAFSTQSKLAAALLAAGVIAFRQPEECVQSATGPAMCRCSPSPDPDALPHGH